MPTVLRMDESASERARRDRPWRGNPTARGLRRRPLGWFLATLVLGALVLGAIGALYYRAERTYLRRQANASLRVITKWKADQIVTWRTDLKADAALVLSSRTFVQQAEQFLAHPTTDLAAQLDERLRSIRLSQGYDAVRLVDRGGTVRLTQGQPIAGALHVEDLLAVQAALRDRATVLTSPHVSPGDSATHLSVVAPLVSPGNAGASPQGAIVLVVSVARVLSPLVATLPVPSQSAEAFLVRRDSDSVRFLTARRFALPVGAAAAEPLTRSEMPAVKILLGDTSLIEGVDYRGVRVLAVGAPVPDSPWFVVAKMDRAEVLTVWRTRNALVLALLLAGAAAVAASATAIWQRALRAGEVKFQAVFDHSTAGISLTGTDGTLLKVNPAFAEMLGYSVQELQTRGFADVTHPDDVAAEREVLRSLVSGEQRILRFEKRYVRRDGTFVWAWVSSTLLRGRGGAPQFLINTVQDITERRRAEAEVRWFTESLERQVRDRTAQLEAVNGELESFAYSVSHDLRAPLRALDGFSAALAKDLGGRIDASGRHYLDRIQHASRRMGLLIDDLLTLSRITRRDFVRASVDLSALAEEVAAELRAEAPDRDAAFAIAPGLKVSGDQALLRVALVNLLGNAWKFTATQPAARIELGVAEREGGPAYFVRDNGVGFDVAYADKLFAPFQRLHSEKEFPGTGVGLATVKRVIARHGGRIWAEASVGGGATFHFTLETSDA
jgi:PAS domain S-box-containing protein